MLFCEMNKYFLFKKCALSWCTDQVITKIINISMINYTVERASQLRESYKSFAALLRVLSENSNYYLYCIILLLHTIAGYLSAWIEKLPKSINIFIKFSHTLDQYKMVCKNIKMAIYL